jgi:ppGpp synthetase/RelA/SpoT-type nucleotidyltranferase
MKNNSVDSYWEKNPLIIKKFLNQHNSYNLLCQEISYILKKELNKSQIDFSAVTHRSKTLNSFIEKIQRKKYVDPFKEITDFSGVRVVFLYVNDYKKIEKLIRSNFEVVEKVDKLNEKKVDQFGYGAIHFIVKLGKKYKGARYDDLNEFVCEIQVRTILQDAWAVIDHHLVYKKEEDVPSHLRRKLNSLAGLFETADDQFERIKEERIDYIKELKEISLSPIKFLDLDINIDSFQEFLEWKYDDKLELDTFDGQIEVIFKDIDKRRYKKLRDLDKVYSIAEKHHKKVIDELDKQNTNDNWSKVLDFALRMVIYDKNIRNKQGVPPPWKEALDNLGIVGNSKRPK